MDPRVLIVIDMQERPRILRAVSDKPSGFRGIVLDRIAALGPADRLVYVAMERWSNRPEPLTVQQAQEPGLLRQPLLDCFDGSTGERDVYVKRVWDGASSESLVRHLDEVCERSGIRVFELVGAFGECCVASSANGLRKRFPHVSVEVNEECVKFLLEHALGRRRGRELGRRVLHARTRKLG